MDFPPHDERIPMVSYIITRHADDPAASGGLSLQLTSASGDVLLTKGNSHYIRTEHVEIRPWSLGEGANTRYAAAAAAAAAASSDSGSFAWLFWIDTPVGFRLWLFPEKG